MSLLIFRFWTAAVLTFCIKNALKLPEEKASQLYLNVERLKLKVRLRAAKRKSVFEIASHFK